MKRLICSLTLLAAAICFSVFNMVKTENTSRQFLLQLKAIEQAYAENPETAKKQYADFLKDFSAKEEYLCISLNHQEIDLLREALAKTDAYLSAEQEVDFRCEFENLKRLMEHVGKLENLRWGNVL